MEGFQRKWPEPFVEYQKNIVYSALAISKLSAIITTDFIPIGVIRRKIGDFFLTLEGAGRVLWPIITRAVKS